MSGLNGALGDRGSLLTRALSSQKPDRPNCLQSTGQWTALQSWTRDRPVSSSFGSFGGLSVEETAAVLGISPKTVKRDWSVARAWLYQDLQAGHENEAAQLGTIDETS